MWHGLANQSGLACHERDCGLPVIMHNNETGNQTWSLACNSFNLHTDTSTSQKVSKGATLEISNQEKKSRKIENQQGKKKTTPKSSRIWQTSCQREVHFFNFASCPLGVWRPWKSDGSSALRLYATYTATKQRVKRFLSSSNEDSWDSRIPGKPRCFQVVKTKTLLYIIWNVQVVDTSMGPNSHVLHLAESSVNSDACQTLSSPGVQAASCCTAKETRQTSKVHRRFLRRHLQKSQERKMKLIFVQSQRGPKNLKNTQKNRKQWKSCIAYDAPPNRYCFVDY